MRRTHCIWKRGFWTPLRISWDVNWDESWSKTLYKTRVDCWLYLIFSDFWSYGFQHGGLVSFMEYPCHFIIKAHRNFVLHSLKVAEQRFRSWSASFSDKTRVNGSACFKYLKIWRRNLFFLLAGLWNVVWILAYLKCTNIVWRYKALSCCKRNGKKGKKA